jgi:hypothetical protein
VIVVFASAGVAVFAAASLAANVDYEGESLGVVPPGTSLVFEGPLYITTNSESEIADGAACAPNCPDNGTKYQISHVGGFPGSLVISGNPVGSSCPPDCNTFDLFKIDVAEPSPGTGPIILSFSALFPSGSEDFNFVTDGVVDGAGGQADFETVVLPDTFRDLRAVGIVSAAPYLGVAIDNIIVEPEIQPTPALGPFGLGTLALVLCACAAWIGHTRTKAH